MIHFFAFQGLLKFYDTIIQAILRHVNFDGKIINTVIERLVIDHCDCLIIDHYDCLIIIGVNENVNMKRVVDLRLKKMIQGSTTLFCNERFERAFEGEQQTRAVFSFVFK